MTAILDRSKEPYYNYEPYYKKGNKDEPGWQWVFLASSDDYKGRVALGGNRIGKTRQAMFELVLAVLGEHPCRKFPLNGIAWVIAMDFPMSTQVDLPMFDEFLPKHIKARSKFHKDTLCWDITRPDDGHWLVYFKSSESGREKFQGQKLDIAVFDEEPKKTEIFSEVERGLVDNAGVWWIAATPVMGTVWLKNLSQRPDVFSITAAMWDNPYIPQAEIANYAASLSEEERLVRIEGQYIVYGGKPVFKVIQLQKSIEKLKEIPNPSVGIMEVYDSDTIKFQLVDNGPIKIWEYPEPETKYTIGIDTATGVSQDWTVGVVLSNRIPFEQVAMFRAKLSPREAGPLLMSLGKFYNQALAVIETTGIGFSMQDAFMKGFYPRNYQLEQHADEDPNVSSKYGWSMTQPHKWLVIRETKELLEHRDGAQLILNDSYSIEEFCNYVYIEDKSKTGAAEGLNDDIVIATMLAVHGATLFPQRPKPKAQPLIPEGVIQSRSMMKSFMDRIRKQGARKEGKVI